MTTRLILPYGPSDNSYYVHTPRGVFISAKGKRYREIVAEICRRKKLVPIEGPVVLSVVVYRPRKIGDLGNNFKALCDAMNKLAYHDDSQIQIIHAEKRDDSSNPRVVVNIRPMKLEDVIVIPSDTEKPWEDLPVRDYEALKNSGQLWDIFPNAPR